jgi:PTS system nitrogen regulatory IIA component
VNCLQDLLTPQRCLCHIQGGSRKRLFEVVADVLVREQEAFHPTELVAGMLAREKLGCTALGDGIAIPHCRLADCETASGVLITLATPADFESPDGEDVDIIFALVVPLDATQEHLNLLADIARMFSQAEFRQALRECRTSEALYTTAINWAARGA